MDGNRSVSWKMFKESLGNLDGKKIMYIDEEGTELPINTDAEFQEALRLAKRQDNRVRFILVNENLMDGKRAERPNLKPKEKLPPSKEIRKEPRSGDIREVKEAVHVNDVPPEWFFAYMRKFKKDLLAEVNNTIYDAIHKAYKREAKFFEEKMARGYEWDNVNYNMGCAGAQYYYRPESFQNAPTYYVGTPQYTTLHNVRLRSTDKVYYDVVKDDKGVKPAPKQEKSRVVADKRQKAGQAPSNTGALRIRPYPKIYLSYVHDFGPMKPMKSGSFTSKLSAKKLEVFHPYALWFLLGNNGSVPWSQYAYVKCYYNPEEFEVEEDVIDLPPLNPGIGANVAFEVTPLKVGSFSFTCAIVDGGVEIGERILCRFDVVDDEATKANKATKVPVKRDAPLPYDQYEDEVIKTQKKIKENIKTIMKRLSDIEILNSESDGKGDSKKKEEDSVKVGQKRNRKKRMESSSIDFRTGFLDLLQNLESARMNEEGKLKGDEKELVNDILVGTGDKEKQSETGKKKGEVKDTGSGGASPAKDDKEEVAEAEKRDSDSELSVIMASEEEDNFIVLSIPSRTPSPETEVKELENDKEKAKEKEKEKEKEKKSTAAVKESRPEVKKSVSFGSGFIFDPWNEGKNGDSSSSDSCNEKWSKFDPFDDLPKSNDEIWANIPINVPVIDVMVKGGKIKDVKIKDLKIKDVTIKQGINLPELPDGPNCFYLDSKTTPEELWTKLKEKGASFIKDGESGKLSNGRVLINKGEMLTKDKGPGRNGVFVVDNGGKVTGMVPTETKEGAAIEKGQESVAIQKGQEYATIEKNRKKGGQGGSAPQELFPTVSEQLRECLLNLGLYNAGTDATKMAPSPFNSAPSAFHPVAKKKKLPTENNNRPVKMMEALVSLEDMGFKDRIRNRELLMVHKLNMAAVIEELLEKTPSLRENPPKGLFVSKKDFYMI